MGNQDVHAGLKMALLYNILKSSYLHNLLKSDLDIYHEIAVAYKGLQVAFKGLQVLPEPMKPFKMEICSSNGDNEVEEGSNEDDFIKDTNMPKFFHNPYFIIIYTLITNSHRQGSQGVLSLYC
ncbi:hypothetical protein L2E82_26579 [Cichorium intybus]|uniref:Uncharacterized protein n=1 Tax=Cichorium intybus TaxID=13427 RepID=A0ACB9CQV2_CICIN|nr:hypothetical protein L2E82_26579 [Cichorium intybus]